jgi:hypothetical protein
MFVHTQLTSEFTGVRKSSLGGDAERIPLSEMATKV